jgi:hypothetical protein
VLAGKVPSIQKHFRAKKAVMFLLLAALAATALAVLEVAVM